MALCDIQGSFMASFVLNTLVSSRYLTICLDGNGVHVDNKKRMGKTPWIWGCLLLLKCKVSALRHYWEYKGPSDDTFWYLFSRSRVHEWILFSIVLSIYRPWFALWKIKHRPEDITVIRLHKLIRPEGEKTLGNGSKWRNTYFQVFTLGSLVTSFLSSLYIYCYIIIVSPWWIRFLKRPHGRRCGIRDLPPTATLSFENLSERRKFQTEECSSWLARILGFWQLCSKDAW